MTKVCSKKQKVGQSLKSALDLDKKSFNLQKRNQDRKKPPYLKSTTPIEKMKGSLVMKKSLDQKIKKPYFCKIPSQLTFTITDSKYRISKDSTLPLTAITKPQQTLKTDPTPSHF